MPRIIGRETFVGTPAAQAGLTSIAQLNTVKAATKLAVTRPLLSNPRCEDRVSDWGA
ncbi:MAG: hypothetical protein ACJ780_01985 [Solirubrobacteraceae bacterium]